MSELTVKVCASCKEAKPLSDFSNRKASPDGHHYYCRLCSDEKCKADRAKHREKRKQQQKESRDNNKDEINRRNRERYSKDEQKREKARASASEWANNNKERKKKNLEKWRLNNRDKWNATQKKSRWEHIDKYRAKWVIVSSTRRSRIRGADGNFLIEEWEALKDKYHYTCLCCKRKEPEIQLTVDHVVPISKGGKNDISNIQPLCLSCNSSKNDSTVDYR